MPETTINNHPQDRKRTTPISWRIRRKKRSLSTVITLNLTPMIDVVFLLLFFFMVASRFQAFEGMLPARLPAQSAVATHQVPRSPIRIRFLYDEATPGQCLTTIDRLNESPFAVGRLTSELKKIHERIPGFDQDTPVHLLADDNVPWDHVVNAYNAAMAADFEKIFFIGSQ